MEGLAGKRILLVITKPVWGGAQAYVHTLATRYQEAGARVMVATGTMAGREGSLPARLRASGIPVLPLPSLMRDIDLLSEVRALMELVALIRQERPDILHLNSSKAGALGALAGRIARVPRIVFTAHGWPHREPRSFPVRAFIWLASWLTVQLAHRVIAVSRCDLATAPVLFSKKRIRVVHNGVAPFVPLPRVRARQELLLKAPGLIETVPWLLMLAELHTNKGIDTAIRALAQLAAHPAAALVVLGEGEERARLEALIERCGVRERVFLLGFVPDARTYLSAGDCFLMPSRKEGFPMAVLEAGMAGLPVVASRTGGIPEIIEHGSTGLLVPTDDARALAKALDSVLSSQRTKEALGSALRARVEEEFSEEKMLEGTAAAYVS